jgi:hypothetical protein
MRNVLCMALAFVGLVACDPAAPADGGIEGYVTSGPSCPVARPDVLCPDKPYAAALSILAHANSRPIASVTADDSGYYKVLLPPGTYIIHAESPGVFPRASDVVVDVLPHRFTRQDIQYDTGIR